jgi:hypothetical protein
VPPEKIKRIGTAPLSAAKFAIAFFHSHVALDPISDFAFGFKELRCSVIFDAGKCKDKQGA